MITSVEARGPFLQRSHKMRLIELAGASLTVLHQREHCSTLAERENVLETRKQQSTPTQLTFHVILSYTIMGCAVLIQGFKRKLILLNFELSHNLTSGKRFVATQAIAHYVHSTATALNTTRGSGRVAFFFRFAFSRSRSRSHAMCCAIELVRACCSVSVACGSVACLFSVWACVFCFGVRYVRLVPRVWP